MTDLGEYPMGQPTGTGADRLMVFLVAVREIMSIIALTLASILMILALTFLGRVGSALGEQPDPDPACVGVLCE